MDTCNLSLNNFSSIFELLGAYYILLSISTKLEDYLGLSSVFKQWHSSFNESSLQQRIDFFKNEINTSTEVIVSTVEKQHFGSYIMDLLKRYNKEKDSMEKEINKASKIVKQGEALSTKIDLHYKVASDEGYSFFDLIKPAYVFSGIAILSVMILGGVVTKWENKYTNLYFINLSLIITLIISTLQIVLQKPISIFNQKTLLYIAIVFYLVLTIIPGKFLDSACYIQYEFANLICINDFHILLFLLLIFSPILIHIISLQRLHRKCKSYDKKLNDLLSEQLPVKVNGRKSNEIMELPS